MSRKYYEVDLRALRESLEEEETEQNEDMYEEEETEQNEEDELAELYEQFSTLLEQDEEDMEGMEDMGDMEDMDDMEGMDDMEAAEGEENISMSAAREAIQNMVDELGIDMEDVDEPAPEFDFEDDEQGENRVDEVFNVDPRVLRQEINRIKKFILNKFIGC